MLFLGYTALLLCWMHCAAERACTDPPPRRVKEIPTETWDKPPYPHGTQVTYRCRPGYIKIGRIVFRCTDGTWKQQLTGAECRNKPCGHPGDIEFGSFELTSGSEFVFGARVEYRCDDGYWMLSQKNYRECQADGWSNDVPHCEVAKCLPLEAPANGRIITTGAFELDREYSFGQVVNFECDAEYKLVGNKELICSSNGQWNSDVPQCQEVHCNVPEIPHGYLRSPKLTYKKSEKLQFACNEGYKQGERADVRCTESGWNPTPYCIEKKCDYLAIENGELSRTMEYFPMVDGQEVYYRCLQGYSTPNGQHWFRLVCSAAGWSAVPKCLKQCRVTNLHNGAFVRSHSSVYKEGESTAYVCKTGYSAEHENGEVTCTNNGWSPQPKCIRKKVCRNTNVGNGYLIGSKETFALQDRAFYHCYAGFVTPEGKERGKIQCQENGWTPLPRCIKSCKAPSLDILNYPANKTVFVPDDTIEYACAEGSQTADKMPTGTSRCGVNGEWSPKPQCIAIECEMLTLLNGEFSPWLSEYHNGHVVKFTCRSNYVRWGPASSQCYYFGWFPSPPLCKENKMPCGSPSSIPNVHCQRDQAQFSHGDEITCGCKQSSNNSGETIRCLNGEWKPFLHCPDPHPQCALPKDVELVSNHYGSKPRTRNQLPATIEYRCTPADNSTKLATCVSGKWSPEIECADLFLAEKTVCPPPPQVPGAQQIAMEGNYKNGSKISFSCLESFQLVGAKEITCIEGKWQSPPHCVARSCSPPEPPECADDTSLETPHLKIKKNGETMYLHGARLKYIPHSGYKFSGPPVITCSMGNWTSAPTCLEMPCGSIPRVANAKIEGRHKETYEPGETIHYRCAAGFQIIGSPEIFCREGNWTEPPSCEDLSCGAPPEILNAYITSTQQEKYGPGATVQYECGSNFQMMGGNYITCTNGGWSKPPTCRDMTCGPPPEIAGGKVQGARKARYLPGERARYQCWQGSEMTGADTVACENGTWTELPKCKGINGKCGPAPVIENGDILTFPMKEYPQGATLTYKCPNLYVLEGSETITCNNGQWTNPPVCLAPCTTSEEDMNTNNIELRWSYRKKMYSKSGDIIEFRCKRGYMEDPTSSPFRVWCVQGTLEYPRCKPAKDCTVDQNIMARNHIKLGYWKPLTYAHGDTIEFGCTMGYRQHSRPKKFNAVCKDGGVTYPLCA